MPTFDFSDLTAESESDPRRGDFDTLQWHHSVTTTYEAARELMDPGGRTVSANGLMTADGRLGLVVDLSRRAFTSASSFDHRSLTIECVNTSGGPEYGLSDATHRRLGQTLAEMVREGRSQVIYGPGGLIQHKDVPGSYATACAGPSADSSRVLAYAAEYINQANKKGADDMAMIFIKRSTTGNGNRTTKTVSALAGANPGTGAPNWIEYTSPSIAGDWTDLGSEIWKAAASPRPGAYVSDADWERFKAAFLAVAPAGGSAGGSGPSAEQVAAAVDDKLAPRFGSLGTALTGIATTLSRIFK